jgi:hypothetical protein
MGEAGEVACLLLTPERAAALGGACVGLALLVLVAIGVGFALLRPWHSTPTGPGPWRSVATGADEGLLGIWRLSRRLSRSGGHIFDADVPLPMVRGAIVEQR